MTHLLAGLACLGHLVLMTGLHNLLYGIRGPRWLGALAHASAALAVLALPAALLAGWGPSLSGLASWPPSCWIHAAIQCYLALCLAALFLLLPAVTVRRHLRRRPIAIKHRETVDVARELAMPPTGEGAHRWMASLPGNELFQVELIEAEAHLSRLPAEWDGLKLLHLSDFHFHGVPDRAWFAAIIGRCNQWEPDLVALTGDITDSPRHHRWILPLLGRLRAKYGAFAILGNHDYYLEEPELVRRRLRRAGYRVLSNQWAEVSVLGRPLVVVGDERPWNRAKLDLTGCPREAFTLCLSHTPDNIAWARAHGVDLMLSGHVHGGQVRLPVIGPVVMPSKYGRWYDEGSFEEPPTVLYVSRGLSGEEPVRYNCPPEATLITLRRKPPE
jgi:predicted MPP superfamily phosphohydrolase